MKIEEVKDEIVKGIEKFYKENKTNILAVNDELLNSTELGRTQNKSPQATNKILNRAGILEENTDPNRATKWKITDNGRKYAVTPVKFTATIKNENTVIVHLKKENPSWTGKLKREFANIVKKDSEINRKQLKEKKEEEENGRK